MFAQTRNLQEQRLEVCRKCPFVRQAKGLGLTCGTVLRPEKDRYGNQLTCGCVLSVKTALAKTSCPQKKW